jgi:predicted transcriptional regulator
MEVLLPQNQESQLKELAVRTGRPAGDLVPEAVARLLAHNERFKQEVQVGIDQIARGEFIEEEEMDGCQSRADAPILMRSIRWAPAAADDLQAILNYLLEQNRTRALSTGQAKAPVPHLRRGL